MSEVQFCGEQFRTGEKFGLMPLMRFAVLAKGHVDARSMEGLAAVYDLLRECLADEAEWERFQQTAIDNRSDVDELMGFLAATIEAMTERPTSQPSDSSAGLRTIEPKSTDDSYSRVIARLEGRPDLQLMVMQAQESRTA